MIQDRVHHLPCGKWVFLQVKVLRFYVGGSFAENEVCEVLNGFKPMHTTTSHERLVEDVMIIRKA